MQEKPERIFVGAKPSERERGKNLKESEKIF
jgi:hypothetical protein